MGFVPTTSFGILVQPTVPHAASLMVPAATFMLEAQPTPTVGIAVAVGVSVTVGVGVLVGVEVEVLVGVFVGVFVGGQRASVPHRSDVGQFAFARVKKTVPQLATPPTKT